MKTAKPVAAEKPKMEKATKIVKAVTAKPIKKKGVVANAAAATGKSGRISKKTLLRGKGLLKKKKVQLRFGIDCTNIAEDSIMDVVDFVSILNNPPPHTFTATHQINFSLAYRKNTFKSI